MSGLLLAAAAIAAVAAVVLWARRRGGAGDDGGPAAGRTYGAKPTRLPDPDLHTHDPQWDEESAQLAMPYSPPPHFEIEDDE